MVSDMLVQGVLLGRSTFVRVCHTWIYMYSSTMVSAATVTSVIKIKDNDKNETTEKWVLSVIVPGGFTVSDIRI